ncbi:hypothetical protein FJT64_013121 [Amphibalanus amphitrite]|uniref:Uncharacterized protein n=1 Tax=Amphibalanus amphitrite TaxID=1232801 RepID=A0A6A4V5M7_AMPAM|nr:hypothetical protein FJT64_013121 [Amphibalanus amphitrite]
MRPPEKRTFSAQGIPEKNCSRALVQATPSPSPSVSRSDAHRIQTEESEALDEPVSCRAEDAASEDRQFRLVNLAALTPSSWPTGECLHSSSLAPPLRVRVQTAVGPRASLAASVVAVLRGGMHPGAAG